MGKLTEKMKIFVEEYVKNGYNGAKAYNAAYNQDNKNICGVEAFKLLRDPRIVEQIEIVEGDFRTLGQAEGLDKKTVVKMLSKMIQAKKVVGNVEVDDFQAIEKGIKLFCQLTGDFKERKEINVKDSSPLGNIDIKGMGKEDLEKLEKDILEDL